MLYDTHTGEVPSVPLISAFQTRCSIIVCLRREEFEIGFKNSKKRKALVKSRRRVEEDREKESSFCVVLKHPENSNLSETIFW